MTPDRRYLPNAELRAKTKSDGAKIFTGYAAVYNTESCDLGMFTEIIRPGAFDRCLPKADVRCLMNHDANLILGRSRMNASKPNTLRLETDGVGLRFECDVPNVSYAQDLWSSIDRGDVDGCSFRFYVAEGGDRWNPLPNGRFFRELLDVEIDEVSIVVFPAYTDTSVETNVSARSLERRDAFAKSLKPLRLLDARRRLAIADRSL